MKKIELRAFTTWLNENDICYTMVKNDADIQLQDAIENTAAVKEISEGKVYPMLVNLKGIKTISKDARDHFSMQGRTPGVTAIAMLIKSPVSKIIGNFFLGLNRSAVPSRLFTSEEKAIEWLKQYMK